MDNDLEEAAKWYCNNEITCFDSDNSDDQFCITLNFYSTIRSLQIRDKIKATKSTEEYKKKYHDSRVKMWQNPEYRKHRKELSERRKNERK